MLEVVTVNDLHWCIRLARSVINQAVHLRHNLFEDPLATFSHTKFKAYVGQQYDCRSVRTISTLELGVPQRSQKLFHCCGSLTGSLLPRHQQILRDWESRNHTRISKNPYNGSRMIDVVGEVASKK